MQLVQPFAVAWTAPIPTFVCPFLFGVSSPPASYAPKTVWWHLPGFCCPRPGALKYPYTIVIILSRLNPFQLLTNWIWFLHLHRLLLPCRCINMGTESCSFLIRLQVFTRIHNTPSI